MLSSLALDITPKSQWEALGFSIHDSHMLDSHTMAVCLLRVQNSPMIGSHTTAVRLLKLVFSNSSSKFSVIRKEMGKKEFTAIILNATELLICIIINNTLGCICAFGNLLPKSKNHNNVTHPLKIFHRDFYK